MKRQRSTEPWEALLAITDAAERFVNRSPRSKRLEAERQALLDAIRQAQLLLSVRRFSASPEPKPQPAADLAADRNRRKSPRTETPPKRRRKRVT